MLRCDYVARRDYGRRSSVGPIRAAAPTDAESDADHPEIEDPQPRRPRPRRRRAIARGGAWARLRSRGASRWNLRHDSPAVPCPAALPDDAMHGSANARPARERAAARWGVPAQGGASHANRGERDSDAEKEELPSDCSATRIHRPVPSASGSLGSHGPGDIASRGEVEPRGRVRRDAGGEGGKVSDAFGACRQLLAGQRLRACPLPPRRRRSRQRRACQRRLRIGRQEPRSKQGEQEASRGTESAAPDGAKPRRSDRRSRNATLRDVLRARGRRRG